MVPAKTTIVSDELAYFREIVGLVHLLQLPAAQCLEDMIGRKDAEGRVKIGYKTETAPLAVYGL